MESNASSRNCTAKDYRALLDSSSEAFYWLGRTLTGEDSRAQVALTAAFDLLQQGSNIVFSEWLGSWARRQIIKSSISAMEEAIRHSTRSLTGSLSGRWSLPEARDLAQLPRRTLQSRLLALDALPRFAFVLRVMEGYSRRETALLLNIDDRTCESACALAIKGVSPPLSPRETLESQAVACPA